MDKYRKAILAFIDVLGFKGLVEKNNPSLVYKILEIFHEQTEDNRLFGSMGDEHYNPKQSETYEPDIIFFSDSVVRIIFPEDYPNTQTIENKSSDISYNYQLLLDEFLPFRDELVNLCFIQEKLLTEGILIRGGIVYGDVIYDKGKNILFGPALQKAYQIESEFALYPRIIIDSSIIEKATTEGLYHVDALINTDERGFNYIDYVGGSIKWHWNLLTNRLLNYPILYLPIDFNDDDIIKFYRERLDLELLKMREKKASIEKGLSLYYSKNLTAFIKYAWIAEKYNERINDLFVMYDSYLNEKQRDELLQALYEIDFPDMTPKIEELRNMASRYPNRIDIAIEYAKALVNLTANQDLPYIIQSQKELYGLAERFPENAEIAVQLGMSLFNLTLKQDPSEWNRIAVELRMLLNQFPNDVRVARSLAKILVNLAANRDLSDMKQIIEELRELLKNFSEDAEIACMLATSLFNLMLDKDQTFLNITQSIEELRELETRFPKDARISNLMMRILPIRFSDNQSE